MKVCLLTRKFDLSGAGVGRVSGEIQKHLVAQGHEVYSVSDGNSLGSYLCYSLLSIRPKIPKGYDVYHAMTPVESLWIPKERAVVTFHDLFPLVHKDKQGAGVGKSQIKQICASEYFATCVRAASRCKIIACNSEQTKQEVELWLGASRVTHNNVRVVQLGVSDDLVPKPKPDDRLRIGYLGQLDRRKRVDVLVSAFKHSDVRGELVIGGEGPERQALEGLAMGDSRIKFLGFVPDDCLVDFYASLDLFVFPTWVEGYGLPLVEAMACKRPVVVLRDAVIPWEVKPRCTIVDDLASLFAQLRYSQKDALGVLKHYDGFGWEIDDNYAFARKHNWDTTAAEYIKLYKEVLDG